MKQISEKEIAEAIQRDCPKELGKFARAGIDRAPLVMLLAQFVKRRGERMSGGTKKMLRHYHDTQKKLSARLEDLTRELRAFVSAPPYWKPGLESSTGRTLLGMEFMAESLKKDSLQSGQYLWRYGRSNPDVANSFLGWILQCDKDFKCWVELSCLLTAAFRADGIHITKDFSPDMLRMAAKRYRHRRPVWAEKENGT